MLAGGSISEDVVLSRRLGRRDDLEERVVGNVSELGVVGALAAFGSLVYVNRGKLLTWEAGTASLLMPMASRSTSPVSTLRRSETRRRR